MSEPAPPAAGLDAPPAGTAELLTEQLRECGRLFFSRGWSVGTSSNYSCVLQREPLRLAITVSGRDKGRLTAEDFVQVDATGRVLQSDGHRASAETLLHVVISERPDVGAVLHTHSVWATILSDLFAPAGGITISGYEMLKGLSGVATHEHSEWVEILENTQDMPDLSRRVRQRLRDAASDDAARADAARPEPHGFLLRRHGLYTWGRDIAEARRHVEIFEFLFECVGRRMTLNGA